jgi:hypothetical protein
MAVVAGRSTRSLAGRRDMKIRALWIIGLVVLSTTAAADASRQHLSANEAAEIGRKLFPEQCGGRKSRCVFARNPRGSCPFEMFISLPNEIAEESGPKAVWVGLDERKRPIVVASHSKYGTRICAELKQAS